MYVLFNYNVEVDSVSPAMEPAFKTRRKTQKTPESVESEPMKPVSKARRKSKKTPDLEPATVRSKKKPPSKKMKGKGKKQGM